MIPLGVLAGSRYTATPSVVQTGVHKGVLNEQLSIPLNPLTPGNLLVVVVRDVVAASVGADYTFSHPLTKDYDDNRAGWNLSMWSGMIAPGAPSTVVLDQARNPAHDSMGVWELSGVSAFASRTTVQGAYVKTLSPPVHTEPGSLGLVTLMLGSVSTDTGGFEIVNGVVDRTGKGLGFGHVPDPQTQVTVNWTSGNNEAIASVARFI